MLSFQLFNRRCSNKSIPGRAVFNLDYLQHLSHLHNDELVAGIEFEYENNYYGRYDYYVWFPLKVPNTEWRNPICIFPFIRVAWLQFQRFNWISDPWLQIESNDKGRVIFLLLPLFLYKQVDLWNDPNKGSLFPWVNGPISIGLASFKLSTDRLEAVNKVPLVY